MKVEIDFSVANSQNVPEQKEFVQYQSQTKQESSLPVGAPVEGGFLRFHVEQETVQARIFSGQGDLIKTIPPSDLLEIIKYNSVPTVGQLFDKWT